jgi:hypothetical protein
MQVRAYVAARRVAGASDPSFNRELSIIRRGFRLGFEEDPPMVRRPPHILKLDEDKGSARFPDTGVIRNIARFAASAPQSSVCCRVSYRDTQRRTPQD